MSDQIKANVALMTRCVNAHDRCAGSAPCPWCEPIWPLRNERGQFVSATLAELTGETDE